jgi:hypothetical protein
MRALSMQAEVPIASRATRENDLRISYCESVAGIDVNRVLVAMGRPFSMGGSRPPANGCSVYQPLFLICNILHIHKILHIKIVLDKASLPMAFSYACFQL